VAERVLVVVPTYNEKDNLASAIARITASVPTAEILVVDDNSPDGTGLIADRHALVDPRVHVLHRAAKEGLGAAYLEAFAWALDRGYDVVVECDADGSHQPEELPRLLAALAGNDLVLGSRWVSGGRTVNWPLRRQLLSRAGSLYARVMLGLRQKDVTGGYRVFTSRALRAIDLATVTSQGYCFQIEMLWRADRAGLRVVESPITFIERAHGVSKMHGAIAIEALTRVTAWSVLPSRSGLSRSSARDGVLDRRADYLALSAQVGLDMAVADRLIPDSNHER